MPTKTKESVKTKRTPIKWSLSQEDFLEVLETIDTNSKTILTLTNDIKRIKIRMGL